MTREPVLPTARAALFTASCLSLGMAAHRIMSASPIPLWALVLGGIVVYVPARLGARRERGLMGITLMMGALQVMLHLLFSYAQAVAAASECCVGISAPSMAGMPMPAGSSMSLPVSGVGTGMRMGMGMQVAHALAALACAWWLRRGEAAVHALVRGVARWVIEHWPALMYAVPVEPHEFQELRLEPVFLTVRSQWRRTGRELRGPPASL